MNVQPNLRHNDPGQQIPFHLHPPELAEGLADAGLTLGQGGCRRDADLKTAPRRITDTRRAQNEG
ncbi:MAG: hypothetical protein ACRECP_07435 [Methylocella sp.]